MSDHVVITGADGGLGKIFIAKFLENPSCQVSGWGLRPQTDAFLASIDARRYRHLTVDVTDADQVRSAASACPTTNLLVNCAGVELKLGFDHPDTAKAAHLETSVNFLGCHLVSTAFYDILANNRPAKLVNILSIASLVPIIALGAYSASKAAAHVMTLCQREFLTGRGVSVHGVYPGWINVGMGVGVAVPKDDPEVVVTRILAALNDHELSIFPDAMSQAILAAHPHLRDMPVAK